jgi:hypothetical protein
VELEIEIVYKVPTSGLHGMKESGSPLDELEIEMAYKVSSGLYGMKEIVSEPNTPSCGG